MHQVSTIGGASYCMLALLKGLDRSQFEPVVLLRQDGPLADEIRKLGIEVHFLPRMPIVPYNQSLLGYRTLYTYLKVELIQRKFAEKLSQLRIDIMYFNNMMLYPYLKTAKKLGYKTIMHVREHWPKSEHQMQMKRARLYAQKYADAMIAINNYSASLFPECSDKITVIYDWIDFTNRNEPRPYEEIFGEGQDNLKVLLFTGGLARIKGTLEVVRIFSERIKGSEYRLLMMGTGLDYKFQGLSGKIKRLLMVTGWKPYGYRVTELMKKDSRITYIPATYRIVDIYKQAYCMISYFTIPHANLGLAEAVGLETIAIAPRTEEAIEYSDNGKGALLYEINNEDDFLKKFYYLIKNYEKEKEQVANHSGTVKNIFSPEKNIKRLNIVCRTVSKKQ